MSHVVKICPRCKQEKLLTLEHFYADRSKSSGFRSYCKLCVIEESVARKTPEKARAYRAAWEKRNPDKVRVAKRRRRMADPEKYQKRERERILTRDKETHRRTRRESAARVRATPAGRLNHRMSSRMRASLRRGKEGRSWRDILGYSVADLRAHLERQFLPRMGWHNVGEWHIDHIVPLASFTYLSVDDPEFRAAWALTNLRPLWRSKNHSKGAMRFHLL